MIYCSGGRSGRCVLRRSSGPAFSRALPFGDARPARSVGLRAVDPVAGEVEVKMIAVQRVEGWREHTREHVLVEEPMRETIQEFCFRAARLAGFLAEAAEHGDLPAVLQR